MSEAPEGAAKEPDVPKSVKKDAEPPTKKASVSRKAWVILWAMGFGAFIAQMFSTVIGPALPAIQADLGLGLSMTTWTITAYSLAFGTALIAGGKLGDLIGEVKLIIIGYMVFAGGLVIAAIAPSGELLVAARAIQGIGIGISAPATLSIVVNSFPISRRGMAVGWWGAAHGFGLLVGPLIGGYLTELFDWRWIFWVAVPLTAAVIFVTIVATRGYRSVLAGGKYDVTGLVLGGIAITLVTFGFQNAANGWGDPLTWGTLAAGAVLFVLFAIAETKIADPLVDFALWKERLFSGAFFAESTVGFVYIPMLTFVGSLYFIGVLGFSPVAAGWIVVIVTGTSMVLEPPAGVLVDKIGPGIPIAFGLIVQAVALFWMGTFTPETTLLQTVVPLALMGAGVGIALPACNASGMMAVDAQRAGMGSGLMQMTFNIPAALGVAIVTSVVGTVTHTRVHEVTDGKHYGDGAIRYTDAVIEGDVDAQKSVLEGYAADVGEMIQNIVVAAQSSAIALSMVGLGIVAVGGAVMTLLVIGRRTRPDHIVVTSAAEL